MTCFLRLFASLAALVIMSGCAQVLGSLRMDLNDDQASYGPTTGGVYPEGGYLEDGRTFVGHHDRSPSSMRNADRGDNGFGERDDRSGEENPYARGAMDDQDGGGLERAESRQPRGQRRVTRNDFIDQAGDSGSLWAAEGEANFFFSKNRARSPGDIISITIENEMLRDIAAELKRGLTSGERRRELEILEARHEAQVTAKPAEAAKPPEGKDQVATSSAAPEPADLSFGAVDITGVIGVKAGDAFLAEIVERYPNGNYKIRGSKRIPYRNSSKLLSFTGVVRGADLSTDEKISSGKIYEYRLQAVR